MIKRTRNSRGFTLVEVLVGLVIGALVVGGVMGVFSSSLRFKSRLMAKREVWPVLDAAVQLALADPKVIQDGRVTLSMLPEAPEVEVEVERRLDAEGEPLATKAGGLHRALFRYRGATLETSIVLTPDDSEQER